MSYKGVVWYSFGSDTSGPALAKELGFEAAKKTPEFSKFPVVIGFGCKPGEKYRKDNLDKLVASGAVRVLNHPSAVCDNRDKLRASKALAKAGVRVPAFVAREDYQTQEAFRAAVLDGMNNTSLRHPILGLNRSHSGLPYFCYTPEDIDALLAKPQAEIDYFRGYVNGEEYRIHVFRDLVLYGQKKVLAEDPIGKTAEQLLERARKEFERQGKPFTTVPEEAAALSTVFARELMQSPTHILRSIGRGWAFQDVNLNHTPDAVLALAVQAVDALGLDFGAVSINLDLAGPCVTNVITAPSLSETQMVTYVAAFRDFIKAGESREAKTDKKAGAQAIAQPTEQEVRAEVISRIQKMPAKDLAALLSRME